MTQDLTLEDIQEIVRTFGGSGFARLELRLGSVQLEVARSAAVEAPAVDPLPGSAEVVAPFLGMFQAGPGPGAPAFVSPGADIHPDTKVGILRVLKNALAVPAGLSGTVLEVLVEDGQLVEYGQPLLRVSPDAMSSGGGDPRSNRRGAS